MVEFDMVFGVPVDMSTVQTEIRKSSGLRLSATRLDEIT